MKKIIVISVMLALALMSISLAAPAKKKTAPVKKPAVTKTVTQTTKIVVVKPQEAPSRERGLAAKGGLMGGAGVAEIGYYLPTGPVTTGLYIGYGLGNKYNLMSAQLELVKQLGAVNLGFSIDYANYSSAVRNIPGLSGDTAKGAHTGVGLTVGREINNKLSAGIGYSSAFGLLATIGYKF